MRRFVPACVVALLLVGSAGSARAGPPAQRSQLNDASMAIAGTWRSGSFQYTFNANGTYVYVGSMGGSAMRTQIEEEGSYSVARDTLVVSRRRGLITNSRNYRQVLTPETTTFGWRLGNTPSGPALQLIFPDGKAQVFYRQ
jgi:hypothetical protein